eukprot:g7109.t1
MSLLNKGKEDTMSEKEPKKEWKPNTERDAFQDLNASFNLSLPFQWFMPDTERCKTLKHISRKFSKQRADQNGKDLYLSQFDLCFVWADTVTTKTEKNALDQKGKKKERGLYDKLTCKKITYHESSKEHIEEVYKKIKNAGLDVVVWKQKIRRYSDLKGWFRTTLKEPKYYYFMLVGLKGNAKENIFGFHEGEKMKIDYRTKRLLFEAHRIQYTLPLNSFMVEDYARSKTVSNYPNMKVYYPNTVSKKGEDASTTGKIHAFNWDTFQLQADPTSDKDKKDKDKLINDIKSNDAAKEGKLNILTDLDETRLLMSILSDRNEGYYKFVFDTGDRMVEEHVQCGAGNADLPKYMEPMDDGIVAWFPISYDKRTETKIINVVCC